MSGPSGPPAGRRSVSHPGGYTPAHAAPPQRTSGCGRRGGRPRGRGHPRDRDRAGGHRQPGRRVQQRRAPQRPADNSRGLDPPAAGDRLPGQDRRRPRHQDPEPRDRRESLRPARRDRSRRVGQLPGDRAPDLARRRLPAHPEPAQRREGVRRRGPVALRLRGHQDPVGVLPIGEVPARAARAVPGKPGKKPQRGYITVSTCATPEDHAAGNFWTDKSGTPSTGSTRSACSWNACPTRTRTASRAEGGSP